MHRLLLFTFLYLTGLMAWGQAVFRLNSLPADGVVLDKNWKWHSGDNPEWSKPSVDDVRWGTLNPNQSTALLSQLPKQGIGWLRTHLWISPQLRGQMVGMYIWQLGLRNCF